MTTYPVQTRRWTRQEYSRLVELGILHEDERIELIGGQMIVAERWRYAEVQVVRAGGVAAPLAKPAAAIAVDDLLP